MTTKSNTFYVSDDDMRYLKHGDRNLFYLSAESEKTSAFHNKITILWKEDRIAQVSESQIEALYSQWLNIQYPYGIELKDFLKQEIFKDKK